ncbi:MAG: hypothetical protein H7288_09420 [Kineosporiaceae bacterium]|nr:hypothetical protein [Aeromicrobium sp.]
MIRIYLSATLGDVEALAAGQAVTADAFMPASDDEEGEFAAFGEASQHGPVVIAADVEAGGAPVTIDDVASFHVALDDSGDLAWFATQEIDAVLLALRSTAFPT